MRQERQGKEKGKMRKGKGKRENGKRKNEMKEGKKGKRKKGRRRGKKEQGRAVRTCPNAAAPPAGAACPAVPAAAPSRGCLETSRNVPARPRTGPQRRDASWQLLINAISDGSGDLPHYLFLKSNKQGHVCLVASSPRSDNRKSPPERIDYAGGGRQGDWEGDVPCNALCDLQFRLCCIDHCTLEGRGISWQVSGLKYFQNDYTFY